MTHTLELEKIWENYLSPKEGGLPLKADPAQGMPYGGSPSMGSEDCEQPNHMEPSGEQKEIQMALADLQALEKQCKQLMLQMQEMQTIPGWVQAKITVANYNITDVAQFIDYHAKQTDCGCAEEPAAAVRIVAI